MLNVLWTHMGWRFRMRPCAASEGEEHVWDLRPSWVPDQYVDEKAEVLHPECGEGVWSGNVAAVWSQLSQESKTLKCVALYER